ncbi:MAG: peptidoglycan-binding protein [Rhodothermaceae bacterium]|nr:peptidoglycan-binding protein [Rhodothermaceae bacterium]
MKLGHFDPDVLLSVGAEYLSMVKEFTDVDNSKVKRDEYRIVFKEHNASKLGMTVREVQAELKKIGFYTGVINGLCGFGTSSAIRLFQEYVNSIEGIHCVADGDFGPATKGHLDRWLSKTEFPLWTQIMRAWAAGDIAGTEYSDWLQFLGAVKQKYTGNESRVLQRVSTFKSNVDNAKTTSTRALHEWDFSTDDIHLIGIRRNEFQGKFDDIFVLLLKGMVFKFQGSTEPGAKSKERTTFPFLVHSQHEYQFGWHRSSYLALRPKGFLDEGKGVLVLRTASKHPTEEEMNNGELESNGSINIHSGHDGKDEIGGESHGCQVINENLYMAPGNAIIPKRNAYHVLMDLVIALSGDLTKIDKNGNEVRNTSVKYMMLLEDDLTPEFRSHLENAKQKGIEELGIA